MPANLKNSIVATGLGKFSFHSNLKEGKNVQATAQLHSFHMLARLYSKSFELGFSSMWVKSFHVYKVNLEKAEVPEIKLSTYTGS